MAAHARRSWRPVGAAGSSGIRRKIARLLTQGVANRDLKLENLLLDRDGTNGRRPLLKICDFGYSKHELNSPATTGVGTPIYMAPEIIYGSNKYNAKVGSPPASLLSTFPEVLS